MVLDYVFSHVNLLESDYFGLRYCDRSHQTVSTDVPRNLIQHLFLFVCFFLKPSYTQWRDGFTKKKKAVHKECFKK